MEKATQDKFELTAAEIDRYVEETGDLLKKVKIDPKEALRLAERAAFRRLNDTLREELGDDQDREAEE